MVRYEVILRLFLELVLWLGVNLGDNPTVRVNLGGNPTVRVNLGGNPTLNPMASF